MADNRSPGWRADSCVVGSRCWQTLAELWVERSIPIIVGIHVKYYKGVRALENLGGWRSLPSFPETKNKDPHCPGKTPFFTPASCS